MRQQGYLNLSPRTQRIAFNGLLGTLALVLSAWEGMLPPIPVLPPGAKLGLSNLVTMYAAGTVGLGPALCIAILKGLFAGITRGFVAMLMSLSGGVASTLVMWFFHDSNGIVDESVLEKLRLNIRSLIASQEEDSKDLLDLCIDVLYHNNMKAFGLQPVSYTHLDVYKRQAISLVWPLAIFGYLPCWRV